MVSRSFLAFACVVYLSVEVSSRNCQCRAKQADVNLTGNQRSSKQGFDEPALVITPTFRNDEEKQITVKNSCTFEVEVGSTGSDKGPSKNGVCPENQIDNGNERCFWNLTDFPDKLEVGGEYTINLGSKDDHLFSGNVWGVKKGQMELSCPSGECKPWVGPKGAITKVEFTLSKAGIDYFDTSIIEGVNIPMSMYPADVEPDPNDRYMCGVAGGCSWDFDPEPNLKKYVTNVISVDGTKCEVDSECTSGQVCGASFASRPPDYGVCGIFNGYASAHVSCMSGSTGAPFYCEDNKDVISCMGDYNLSGYNQPPGTKVCGCIDWELLGIDAPTHVPCETTDKNWEEKSLPFLKFLKKGCPLSFIFAYDDFTGVVTCSSSRAYTIEFCPNDSENNFFGSKQ